MCSNSHHWAAAYRPDCGPWRRAQQGSHRLQGKYMIYILPFAPLFSNDANSSGNTLALSMVLDWSPNMSALIASLQFSVSSCRLPSPSKEWNWSLCECQLSPCVWFRGLTCFSSAASETESPRRNIAKAVRRVFWRILIFYVCLPYFVYWSVFSLTQWQILGILMIGMLVAYNDQDLLSLQGEILVPVTWWQRIWRPFSRQQHCSQFAFRHCIHPRRYQR